MSVLMIGSARGDVYTTMLYIFLQPNINWCVWFHRFIISSSMLYIFMMGFLELSWVKLKWQNKNINSITFFDKEKEEKRYIMKTHKNLDNHWYAINFYLYRPHSSLNSKCDETWNYILMIIIYLALYIYDSFIIAYYILAYN